MNHWHLKTINWLTQLPPEVVDRLRAASSVRVASDGQTVFAPDPEPQLVYLLESGVCRIFRHAPDGSEFTLGLVVKGEIFGELAVIGDGARESFAVAQAECIIWSFPRGLFVELLHTCPSFAVVVTKQVSGKLYRFETRAEDLVFRSAVSRIARILLNLDAEFGADGERGRTIGVRFTQAELSSMVGASRPTTNLVLNAFRNAGLIEFSDGFITLVAKNALTRISEDPDARMPR